MGGEASGSGSQVYVSQGKGGKREWGKPAFTLLPAYHRVFTMGGGKPWAAKETNKGILRKLKKGKMQNVSRAKAKKPTMRRSGKREDAKGRTGGRLKGKSGRGRVRKDAKRKFQGAINLIREETTIWRKGLKKRFMLCQ